MGNEQKIRARLARIKTMLRTVRHAAIATVNEDSSPHNSPVFVAVDDQLRMYWASHPDAQHSRNVKRTHQAFIVLFDSIGAGGGLYIQARVKELAPAELSAGLAVFNKAKSEKNSDWRALTAAHFAPPAPQRLYVAEPDQLSINISERDEAGRVTRDMRYEIDLEQLKGR